MVSKSKARSKLWDALQKHYTGMYIIDTDAHSMSNINGTPIKITGFAHEMPSSGSYITLDLANDRFIINKTGNYFVSGNIAFIGDNNRVFKVELYINGAPTGAHISRQPASATNEIGAGYAAIMTLNKGDILELYVSSTGADTDFDVHDFQMIVESR